MKKSQGLGKVEVKEKVEITPEMIEAGADALRAHYGEAGEPKSFLRRAVEDVFLAMVLVAPRSEAACGEEKSSCSTGSS